jgi:hypothetical protein
MQLVESGSHVNTRYGNDSIPLVIYAATLRLPRVVRLLIQAGADPNATDNDTRSLNAMIANNSSSMGSSTTLMARAIADGLMDRHCQGTIAQLCAAIQPYTHLIDDCITLIWSYWYVPLRFS